FVLKRSRLLRAHSVSLFPARPLLCPSQARRRQRVLRPRAERPARGAKPSRHACLGHRSAAVPVSVVAFERGHGTQLSLGGSAARSPLGRKENSMPRFPL